MDDWLDLEPEAKAAPPTALVRFGLRLGAKGRARGVVLVRKSVIDELAMSSHRIDVRLGQGANTHQIALVPNDGGRFELLEMGTAKGGGTFRVLLPPIDRWPNAALAMAEAGYEVQQQAKRSLLIVKLPPVLWDPQSRERFLKRQPGKVA